MLWNHFYSWVPMSVDYQIFSFLAFSLLHCNLIHYFVIHGYILSGYGKPTKSSIIDPPQTMGFHSNPGRFCLVLGTRDGETAAVV